MDPNNTPPTQQAPQTGQPPAQLLPQDPSLTDTSAGRNPTHTTPSSFLSQQPENSPQLAPSQTAPQQVQPATGAKAAAQSTPTGMLGGFKFLLSKKGPKNATPAKKPVAAATPGTSPDSTVKPAEDDPTAPLEMTIQDIVAPAAIEVDFNHIQVGDRYYRTLFASGYPRFVGPNWLSPLVNFEHSLTISTFYYPVDSKLVLQKLKRKISEMEATLYGDMEKGKVLDPTVKITLGDARTLQEAIAAGTEKFFHFSMYVTINAENKDVLEKITKNVISTLAAVNVIAKPATLQMEQAFLSSTPEGSDKLYITRNMDTTSLATTFPFVTSELTMDHGIMYGLNMHNKSLIIFDRFDMENANTVIFAKSGAGKSYFVKLEALRSLMLGTDIIIIDPEREFERLCDSVNGTYITFSQDKGSKINPFELSGLGSTDEDELRMKILSLHGFFKVIFGGVDNVESSILDRALILTYREKGITTDPDTQKNAQPPLLEDLYKILQGMPEPEGRSLARRLEKYIIGSAAGVFNEKSNVTINNPFTVFSLRDLQEELRPMAMFLMLDFIWTKIKKDQRKRLLIVDEAWLMMQNEDSAKFIYSIAKRARKYHLGLSTVTQDVEDFLNSDYGRAIVTNSSIQVLLKQSSAAIERIQNVFNLSDGEKHFLLSCDRGEGIFFAGANHVAIRVISSIGEHLLITSDPREVELMKKSKTVVSTKEIQELSVVFDPITAKREIRRTEEAEVQETLTEQNTPVTASPDVSSVQIEESASEQTTATQDPTLSNLTPTPPTDVAPPQA